MHKYTARVTEIVTTSIRQTTGQDVLLEPGDELLTTGQLDSMSVLQVFLQLQEVFGIQIGFDYLTQENFSSISSICALLQEFDGLNHAA